MFKTSREQHEGTKKGDATRDRILEVALELFRKRGFERTTMREIASSAKVSLGAAYYYFPSKEALVHAFYDRVQRAHNESVERVCESSDELLERVRSVLVTKLDVVNDDRALLGALFRYAGDADHPLSVFGESTRGARSTAIFTCARALEGAHLSPPLSDAAARALWLAHLGLLLHFIHDRSPGQETTRRLAARIAELFCAAVRLATLPGASLFLKPMLDALGEAGLLTSQPNSAEGSK
ncbi:MAG: TetR/AcrR family transcriptional regulator [Deltaproteobacteria bacterium]|nr:TetR/AcrR family transcriptional regulator [Deltaproteobacteria bacterium]